MDGWHLSLHVGQPGWHRSTLHHTPIHSLLHIPNKLNMRGCDGTRWCFHRGPASRAGHTCGRGSLDSSIEPGGMCEEAHHSIVHHWLVWGWSEHIWREDENVSNNAVPSHVMAYNSKPSVYCRNQWTVQTVVCKKNLEHWESQKRVYLSHFSRLWSWFGWTPDTG